MGDNSPLFFDLSTVVGGTFLADDQDGDLTNNSPTFSSNNPTFFGGITNETYIDVPAGADFRLIDDIINNGTIEIAEDGDFLLEGPDDTVVRLDGIGTMNLEDRFDRPWHPGKTFINGPGHTLQAGFLTGSRSNLNGAFHTDFVNEGTVKVTRRIFNMRVHQNSGLFDAQSTPMMGDARLGNRIFIDVNGGEYITASSNTATIIEVAGGIFSFGDGSPRTANFIYGDGLDNPGVIAVGPNLGFGGGTLEMKIESSNSFDTISVEGVLSVSNTELALKLTGPASGFSNFGTQEFIRAGGANTYSGSFNEADFSNVPNGGRLLTTDGRASFVVTYIFEGIVPQGLIVDPARTSGRVELSLPLFGPEWDAAPYAFTIPAGAADGANVGTVSAIDPEGDAFTYSVAAGSPFAIDSSGQITVADAAAAASSGTFNLAVSASDGLHTSTTIVTITVGTGSPQNNESCVRQLLSEAGGAFAGETDPTIIGAMAAPDSDGLANIFELWFGTDPASAAGLPTNGIEINPPYVDATVLTAMDDLLDIGGEFSATLATGSFTPANRNTLSEGSTHRVLRFSSTTPAGPRNFIRLTADLDAAK